MPNQNGIMIRLSGSIHWIGCNVANPQGTTEDEKGCQSGKGERRDYMYVVSMVAIGLGCFRARSF